MKGFVRDYGSRDYIAAKGFLQKDDEFSPTPKAIVLKRAEQRKQQASPHPVLSEDHMRLLSPETLAALGLSLGEISDSASSSQATT